MKEYYLKGLTTADNIKYSIEETNWEEIYDATEHIYNLFDIEQKYDLMVGNYLSFEEELLSNALKNSIRSSHGTIERQYLQSIIREVINLVTFIKIFLEHFKKIHFGKLFFESQAKQAIELKIDYLDKKSIWKQFIVATRNLAIHSKVPLSTFIYSTNGWIRIGENKEKNLGHTIIPLLNKQMLLEGNRIDKKILNQIPCTNKGEIDLRLPIRKIISEMNDLLLLVRESSIKGNQRSETIIDKYISKFKKSSKSGNNFCSVYKIEGNKEAKIHLSKEVFKEIKEFQTINKGQGILERRYVHNRIDEEQ